MSIYLGSSEPSKIYVGSNEVSSVYVGTEKVRPTLVWNGDLSKAGTPTSKQISGSSLGRINYSIQFNPTGTKCYYCSYYIPSGSSGPVFIAQLSLSTPRDITTASQERYTTIGSSISFGYYPSMVLANDGNYLYLQTRPSGSSGQPKVLYKYQLATAWDLSSAWTQITTYSGNYMPLWWSSDGTKFMWTNGSKLYYSTTTTAWTPNFTGTEILSAYVRGVRFSKEGDYMYTINDSSTTVTKYSLTTAFTPTSKTQVQQVTLSGISGNGFGLCFDTYGNNLYIAGANNQNNSYIYQYSLQ